MALDEYPYDEFVRYFDAILPPLNAAPRTFAHDLHVLREHIDATYSSHNDRLSRGSTVGMVASYLSKHFAEFDEGLIAISGSAHNVISEPLLRALHALIYPYCFGKVRKMPKPKEVRKLALKFQTQAR